MIFRFFILLVVVAATTSLLEFEDRREIMSPSARSAMSIPDRSLRSGGAGGAGISPVVIGSGSGFGCFSSGLSGSCTPAGSGGSSGIIVYRP